MFVSCATSDVTWSLLLIYLGMVHFVALLQTKTLTCLAANYEEEYTQVRIKVLHRGAILHALLSMQAPSRFVSQSLLACAEQRHKTKQESKKARQTDPNWPKLTQTDPNWQPANRHGFTESWVHLYSKSWRTRRVFPEGKSTKYLQAASKSTNEATSCSPATVLVWQVQQATGWAPRDRPQAAVVEWWHKRPKQLVGPLLDLPQGQDCARKQLEISFQVVAGNTNASWAATLCRSCTNIRATAMGAMGS